ncbi:MAG: UvrD-helicase domain-containing protein [Bacteroidales bacterium]|nr:UvrD-helicase domain-containing protein [Bacteroidales bacterium]
MFDYLKELNKAQYEAVVNTEGPALVIAGAGSGKTRVLTYRIAHLLRNGVRPSSVLALTFTNKAAREMKERIAGVVGENEARYLWMGTFHSVFARILRREYETTGYPHNFTIFDAADSKSLIKSVIKSFKLDEKVYKPGVVASRISMAKNNLITPVSYAQNPEIKSIDSSMQMPLISEIYREYSKRSFLSGAMDFDDLLLKTNQLFKNNPAILEKYQLLFNYLLVDEYQDTNYSQYLIVKKLAQRHQNLCVVGDDAQSIYSFRGARIENILSFQHDYPNHKIFKLEQNYRSTRTIVNAANSIIAKNKRQIPKTVYSEKETGRPIKVISALTDNEEGFLVAQEIAETQLRSHYKNMDYAILYRTNAQSRIFEEALRKRNIPYKIYGGLSFYQRKEIKDIIAFFRIVVNPWDNEAIKRIINIPSRGIGQTTIARLEEAAVSMESSIWKIIEGLPENNPAGLNKGTIAKIGHFAEMIRGFMKVAVEDDAFTAAGIIADKTGILQDLRTDKSPEGVSRYENIQELLNGIKEFSLNALEEGRPGKLSDFLEDVSLLTDQDTEKDDDRDKVTLMTVHSAKGLEFKNVFVVGLEEKLFPSLQAVDKKSAEAVEEERRLFYVALTRAGENAWVSFAGQRYRWGKPDFCTPSRFLTEMDKQFLEGFNIVNKRFAREDKGAGQPGSSFYREKPDKYQPVPKPYRTEIFRNKINSSQLSGSADDSFEGDDPAKIVQGMMVEHQRFGTGKVLRVEGVVPDKKAFVFFQNAGNKQLLLKFAKLKIIG